MLKFSSTSSFNGAAGTRARPYRHQLQNRGIFNCEWRVVSELVTRRSPGVVRAEIIAKASRERLLIDMAAALEGQQLSALFEPPSGWKSSPSGDR